MWEAIISKPMMTQFSYTFYHYAKRIYADDGQSLYALHDYIIWNYWPFVRGIHQSLVDSHHKGPVMWSFDVLVVDSLKNLMNKQSSFQ